MMIKDIIRRIINLLVGSTPSCVLLGYKINNNKTCEDIFKAFDFIFFATFTLACVMMTYRLLKIIVTTIRILHFRIVRRFLNNKKTLSKLDVSRSLIDELNVIWNRYSCVWNKQTKAAMLDSIRKHTANCDKCCNSICIRDILNNCSIKAKRNDSSKANGNELNVLFLNQNFNKANNIICDRQNRTERRISKVNEWLTRQLYGFKELEFRSDVRNKPKWCITNNSVPISNKITLAGNNKNEVISLRKQIQYANDIKNKNTKEIHFKRETAVGDIIEESKRGYNNDNENLKSTKTNNSTITLCNEIKSNINETQLALNSNCACACAEVKSKGTVNMNNICFAKKKQKVQKKYNALIKYKSNQTCKQLLCLTPDKAYPMWFVQNSKQSKTVLRRLWDHIGEKNSDPTFSNSNLLSVTSSGSFTNSSSSSIIDTKNYKSNIKMINYGNKRRFITPDKNTKLVLTNKRKEIGDVEMDRSEESIVNTKDNMDFYKNVLTNKVRNVKKAIAAEYQKTIKNNKNIVHSNKIDFCDELKTDIDSFDNKKDLSQKVDNHNSSFQDLLRQRWTSQYKSNDRKNVHVNCWTGEKFNCGFNKIRKKTDKVQRSNYNSSLKQNLYGIKSSESNHFKKSPYQYSTNKWLLCKKSDEIIMPENRNRKRNSFKDEIIYNVVNLPELMRKNMQSRYKLFQINNKKKKLVHHTTNNRLGVIFENSPWAK